MVEGFLRGLEVLLAREDELARRLLAREPGGDDALLQELGEVLQGCAGALALLGRVGPKSDWADPDGGRLRELGRQREANCALLQKALRATGEKIAALRVEKKALSLYRPGRPEEAFFLDRKG